MTENAIEVYNTGGVVSLVPTTMDQALAFAEQMARAKLVPVHLKESPADCLRVVMQAGRWGMDPFAVADKTSAIHGKLMYEGQLVAALINTRAPIRGRLRYKYTGTGPNRKVVVSAIFRDETEAVEIELDFQSGRDGSQNKALWDRQADQQLAYAGARVWARRYCPELVMGVYTPDERFDDTPEQTVDKAKNVTEPGATRAAIPDKEKKGAAAIVEGELVDDAPKTEAEKPKEEAKEEAKPKRRRGRRTNAQIAADKAEEEAKAKTGEEPAPPAPAKTDPPAKPEESDDDNDVYLCQITALKDITTTSDQLGYRIEAIAGTSKKAGIVMACELAGEFEGKAYYVGKDQAKEIQEGFTKEDGVWVGDGAEHSLQINEDVNRKDTWIIQKVLENF